MPTVQDKKLCFVIAPIGDEGTETRQKSDQILKYIIKPAAEECGYTAIRADEISKPGLITTDVVRHVVNDPLVIADLTGHNPNVFYELALRHATKKPVIQLIEEGQRIPFDVSQSRTIHYENSIGGGESCKLQIIQQIKAIEDDPSDFDNPISASIALDSLRRSDDPLARGQAEILQMLLEMSLQIRSLKSINNKYASPDSIRKITGFVSLWNEFLEQNQINSEDSLQLRKRVVNYLMEAPPPSIQDEDKYLKFVFKEIFDISNFRGEDDKNAIP